MFTGINGPSGSGGNGGEDEQAERIKTIAATSVIFIEVPIFAPAKKID
jgi:hypothetical protein